VIRAVTLDCWGTLLLDSPAADEGYRRHRLAGIEAVLTAAGAPVRPRDLERAYAAACARVAQVWQLHRDVPVRHHVTAMLDALDPALPGRVGDDTLDELVDAYGRPAIRVPPAADDGARAALDALARRGMALAVVSNVMRSSGAVLRAILDQRGLLASFAVLTFSDECGIRKPDPEIFRLALDRLGIRPEHAVHVGDDPVLDVEGARDAGMRVIQVRAGRATGPAKPDAVIGGLRELPGALDRLEP
jgi:putative hydrolase of the HAD superfamily